MSDVLLVAVGAFAGFDVAMIYAWYTIRRVLRSSGVTARAKPYVGQHRRPW